MFQEKKTDWVAGRRYIEEEPPYTRDILKEAQFHSQQEKTKAARETRKTKNHPRKAWPKYGPN